MLKTAVWLCVLAHALAIPLPHNKHHHHQPGTKRHVHHSKKTHVGATPKKGVVSNAHEEAIQHLNMQLCANCCGGECGSEACGGEFGCGGFGDCCTHDCHFHEHYHQHLIADPTLKEKGRKDKKKCSDLIKQLDELQKVMRGGKDCKN